MARVTGFAGGAFFSFEQASTGGGGSTDDVADAFVFNDQFNVPLGSTRSPNTVTVSGLGSTVTITASLSGSTSSLMQVNGGAFQSSAAVVGNSDLINVTHISSTQGLTQTDTTLTLGTVADTFSSVTASTAVGGSITPIAAAVMRRRFN